MSVSLIYGPKQSDDVFENRARLLREHHDWSSPVYFDLAEVASEDSTPSDDILPVIPDVSVGGRLQLLPLTMETLSIKQVAPPPERHAGDEVDSNDLTPDIPWNQELLSSKEAKSLYRISLTHDFSQKDYVAPRGLYNTRNMCFFNSVLQVLVHCAPLNSLLSDILVNTPLSRRDTIAPVLNALIQFVYRYSDTKENRRAISGEDFYDVICEQPQFHVERDRQEDSQEFLSDLLDVLETNFRQAEPTEEDKKDVMLGSRRQVASGPAAPENGWTEVGHKNKAVETQHAGHQDLDNPIAELFGGRFRSVLVKQGGKQSVTTEPFQQVPLDISNPKIYSVQSAFEEVFAEEHLVLGNVPATKKLELDLPPPILIVNLKRFTFIRHGDSYEFGKITKPIMIDEKLTLEHIGRDPVIYTPIGVIYHHGMSATRGHYTADVKVKDQWYSIDDEQVVPVQGSDVVGRNVSEGGGSRSAYMVFYEKS